MNLSAFRLLSGGFSSAAASRRRGNHAVTQPVGGRLVEKEHRGGLPEGARRQSAGEPGAPVFRRPAAVVPAGVSRPTASRGRLRPLHQRLHADGAARQLHAGCRQHLQGYCVGEREEAEGDIYIHSRTIYDTMKVKGKVLPYSLQSVGPGADHGLQAVNPQVTKPSTRW